MASSPRSFTSGRRYFSRRDLRLSIKAGFYWGRLPIFEVQEEKGCQTRVETQQKELNARGWRLKSA
jgi:hypothetical protein